MKSPKNSVFFFFIHTLLVCGGLAIFIPGHTQRKAVPAPPLAYVQGKLVYAPDSLGNRIPDFSYCGYRAGALPIPSTTTGVIVQSSGGDATRLIQAAVDQVSKWPVGKNGLRGTVLLAPGNFSITGTISLHTSGVILKGSGFGDGGTVITGNGQTRDAIIIISGKNNKLAGTGTEITDNYVPVNAITLAVASATSLKQGDRIIITRASTAEWITTLGTDHFGGGITSLGWKPNQRIIEWSRTITAVKGNQLTIDAPITTAIDKHFGGGTVTLVSANNNVADCGVENIQLISSYDRSNAKDEDHRWMGIVIDHSIDTWVRQVRFKHFAGSAVAVQDQASRVTIEDCISLQPVSEIGGERRNTFFTAGQQTLFQRCYAEKGIHDFSTGFCAAGPNAFVQCESSLPYSFSGGIDSWSSGVLFDVVNVDGQAISFFNRGQDGQGAGWNNANSVLWNCTAARIDNYRPPTAQNWAFGSWSQFAGDGYWTESNNSIEPRSLYYAQLKERIGAAVNERVQLMDVETDATSSPTIPQAKALSQLAVTPAKTLLQFINDASRRQLLSVPLGMKVFTEQDIPRVVVPVKTPALNILDGKLVRGTELVAGSRGNVPWWNGSAKKYALKNSAVALTRFVPGRTGRGLTDDLDALTDSMLASNTVAIEQNYGLWYDRRRDDHQRVRRSDGNVWAPFYELPFARSGRDTAWDGLSKYDLTKYNAWYWKRLKEYADLADQKGLLLVHQDYFQHNIIEAGAHYADFPWRTANNINGTGFPEPVPYAGDKRIFMADQFYDTTDNVRRELHKKYIRQCLDNFSGNNGVIQLIGEEYTGPYHFVAFWLNTIGEWERETGKQSLVGLSVTKDVQDSILANPYYASLIDIIDIRYWHYQADGSLYAPQGGQSLAPRQHARLLKPKSSSPAQVFRAVFEYRYRFPGKAVIYSADGFERNGWAVLMAGGSLPNLRISNKEFWQAAAAMKPGDHYLPNSTAWVLMNAATGYVIYDNEKSSITIENAPGKNVYEPRWINIVTGEERKARDIKGQKLVMEKPSKEGWVLWLRKK